jgi:hypothetical protein
MPTASLNPDSCTEMRRELRYQFDAPAFFSCGNARRRRLQGEGSTRDISVLGAFIIAATCPPVESPVQFELFLPFPCRTKTHIRVQGEARVIRVEHRVAGKGFNGFAVVRKDLDPWTLVWNELGNFCFEQRSC